MRYGNYRRSNIAAGTPVQLSDGPLRVSRASVYAVRANTGYICIGDANVRARDSEQNSRSVAGGNHPEGRDFVDVDLYDLWFDATVSGEAVTVDWEAL